MTNDTPPDAKTMIKNLAVSTIRPLFFVIVALAVLWFIGKQIGGDQSILTQLNDTPTARGLITFVVATATVAGALILVLAAIISEGTADDVKMRLNEGRQMMAPLIGILGTIVGFYFGQSTIPGNPPGGTSPQAQELRITTMTLAPEQVGVAGGTVLVTGTVAGGRGPYTYSITVPGLPQPVTGKTDGSIRESLTIPPGTKSPQLSIQLEVTDNLKASTRIERSLKVGSS